MVECFLCIIAEVIKQTSTRLATCVFRVSLTCTGLERASEKRKRSESDDAGRSIASTNSVSVSFNKSSLSNNCDTSRQVQPKVKLGATLLNSYNSGEVNGLIPPETGSNSGTLTSNSNSTNNNETNADWTVPGNDIDCGNVVPNQVAAFKQPSPDDQLQDTNWSQANEAILKAAGSRPLICMDATHTFDGTNLITKPAVNPIISSTQLRTLPDTETLPIIRNCGTSDVVPRES